MATLDRVEFKDIPLLSSIPQADIGSINRGVLVLANHDGSIEGCPYNPTLTLH